MPQEKLYKFGVRLDRTDLFDVGMTARGSTVPFVEIDFVVVYLFHLEGEAKSIADFDSTRILVSWYLQSGVY